MIPPLIAPKGWLARLRYKRCPACRARFGRGPGMLRRAEYPDHYDRMHRSGL